MKSFLFLSIFILFTGCGDITSDDSFRATPGVCGEGRSACLNDLDWVIETNYNGTTFNNKISMKIESVTVLDECQSTRNYPFKVNRQGLVLIQAQDYVRTQRDEIALEIRNCENNILLFFNQSQTFNLSNSKLTINLR